MCQWEKLEAINDSEIFWNVDFPCVVESLRYQNIEICYCVLYFVACSDPKVTEIFLKFNCNWDIHIFENKPWFFQNHTRFSTSKFSLDVDLITVSMHIRSLEDNLCFHACNQNVIFGFLKHKKSPEICIFICMCM